MPVGGAFLGGVSERIPAGKCLLLLQSVTEDNRNLSTASWTISASGRRYDVTAGADGRAEQLVDSGFTYVIIPSITGDYDGLTPQTVKADSTEVEICAFYLTLPAPDVIRRIYPIGAIYISTIQTNPRQILGFGTWEAFAEGRTLLGVGAGYSAGQTGGEATHKLTAEEMPSHSHGARTNEAGNHQHSVKNPISSGISGGTSGFRAGNTEDTSKTLYSNWAGTHSHSVTVDKAGGGQAHNNLPPYIVTYIWQRVA